MVSSFLYLTNFLYQQMNTFGISVFNEPEQMIALYLGMQIHTLDFITHLQKCLQRTKSPPLAITYTYHFLKDKTEEEVSLDIVRFVSQLADISQGVSMSSSLQGVLGESSFLTELRHSLTHKTMVKGSILQLSRTLILEQLRQKYWKATANKLIETYSLKYEKVQHYYCKIYKEQYIENLEWINPQRSLAYFQSCSNYEFKEHIHRVILQIGLKKGEYEELQKYFDKVSEQKQAILLALLIKQYLQGNLLADNRFSLFMAKFINSKNSKLYQQQMVLRECYKAYFLKYLNHAKIIYENLPNDIKVKVQNYWKAKQKIIGFLY